MLRSRSSRLSSTAAVAAAAAIVAGLCSPALAGSRSRRQGHQPAMSWLHVEHPAGAPPVIQDEAGRTVVLRGVNASGFEDDWYRTGDGTQHVQPFWPEDPAAYDGACPANSHLITEPALCEVDAGAPEYSQSSAPQSQNDFAQMRSLGWNVVRLTINWSALEPTPGRYDPLYLDRMDQVVHWAAEQHIYVLLDMHEDNYSRFIPLDSPIAAGPIAGPTPEGGNHADGAPPWAIVTDGEPSTGLFGQPPFNALVEAAFTSFWANRTAPVPQGDAPGTGLQDHYIGAMAAVAKRFKDNPTVVGYEIMNEPLPGYAQDPAFTTTLLYPFYRRVIDAITGVADGAPCPASAPAAAACGYPDLGIHDQRHLFFFEPTATRNLTDVAMGPSVPFSTYPGLVYAPHAYTHVFTIDTTIGNGASTVYPTSYDQAFQTAQAEATALGAALFIGEYGNGSNDDSTILAAETAAQDRHLASSSIWTWKANCDPGSGSGGCPGTWAEYDGDGHEPPAQNLGLKPSRARYLARAYPLATAGTLQAFGYDPEAMTFSMTASASERVRPGDEGRETVINIPAGATGAVAVGGAAVVDKVITEPDGRRLAFIAPTGGGNYLVMIG